jgi:hypothetical protein
MKVCVCVWVSVRILAARLTAYITFVFLTDGALFVYLSSCCLYPSTSHQTVNSLFMHRPLIYSDVHSLTQVGCLEQHYSCRRLHCRAGWCSGWVGTCLRDTHRCDVQCLRLAQCLRRIQCLRRTQCLRDTQCLRRIQCLRGNPCLRRTQFVKDSVWDVPIVWEIPSVWDVPSVWYPVFESCPFGYVPSVWDVFSV